MSDVTGSFVVTRRAMSTTTRGFSVGLAIILLIAALWSWQLPYGAIDATQRLALVVIPTLLASVLGVGTVLDIIRGRWRVLEVDRDGIWIRGMPRLAWSDVADVRTEEIFGFNSLRTSSGTSVGVGGFEWVIGQAGVTPLEEAVAAGEASTRMRLGIVPRDDSLVPAGGALGGLSDIVEEKNQEAAARIGRTPIERAPFGLWETEMDAHLEEVVDEIRKFHEVGEISDLTGVTSLRGG